MNLEKFKPLVFELIEYYTTQIDNPTGGSLHIVLDDGNLDDGDLFHCQEFAQKHKDDFGYFLATLLRYFTKEERTEMHKSGWQRPE